MTPVQIHRSPTAPGLSTGAGHPDTTELRVGDDMTVEVALSVMAGADVEYLLLCDGDDERTGSVTRAELVVHRDSSAYTDRVRLRDVLGVPSPLVGPSPCGASAL
ncbi:CBS domain-containing protein [Streptomyces chartreusis]|uniref:CBS domain-containing protein n=1 Tax=Streptomyces TaxID=1883 RepID=UPI0036AD32FE